ncbi:hypothetical protein EK21DRAFT_99281 [Setomelanomma holmii]|uniref:GST N-terminal domain-containing protein n=1 Tax=Setomelanomma holmii TaxID=210430 RepID=A0A9P4HF92_9PLEO|nr:hypothetical protein EK21DRAFT_99281 [Setomelanomma holmii]
MQQSSPVLQQLRTLHHPGTLQHLQQSPDGALYPHPQTIPLYQQEYALSGPPQPSPHALQYQQHGLPASPAQYPAAFPTTYQHASSPRFAVANPPPLPIQHFQQQVPLPPAPPLRAAPQSSPPREAPIHSLQPLLHQQTHGEALAQIAEADDAPSSNHGQFQGLKLIADPPDLEAWRQKLFDVDDTMTLSEEEFKTYFPHIDNVYSHRSTQRHKRKRFVSHYWDCRLKGRPPGTKKSTDPDKKKRKRVARERDLCDVKIKITEYFDQQEYEEQVGQRPPGADDATSPASTNVRNAPSTSLAQNQQFFGQTQMLPQRQPWDIPQNITQAGMAMPQFTAGPGPPPLPRPPPKKYYTLQRVNGNGGNGKGDGVAGPHKHTLEESDRVKKNSVIRWMAKRDKDDRKKSLGGDPSKKTYHKKATGNALTTVKNHSKEDDLKLYGSAFCPFVQRVWISLEHKQIPYHYIEVDPYKKPQSLLDVNPRGLVPALRHGPTWSTHESTVIMEYLEDLNAGPALLPPDPQTRATSRLWSDHVNRHIIPAFYKLLQAQDSDKQIEHATELRSQITKLVDAAHPTGPFFLGPAISFVDVQVAPWMLRLSRVLKPYRGWPDAEEGSRWGVWIRAVEEERSVRATTSGEELYLDSYERYAENRPGTSQLADAVNSGRGLP